MGSVGIEAAPVVRHGHLDRVPCQGHSHGEFPRVRMLDGVVERFEGQPVEMLLGVRAKRESLRGPVTVMASPVRAVSAAACHRP
jgi:hypothetical protein